MTMQKVFALHSMLQCTYLIQVQITSKLAIGFDNTPWSIHGLVYDKSCTIILMLWDSKFHIFLQFFFLYLFILISWINDNNGENLTYNLWDYSLKTDPDYMLAFWRINAAFDRVNIERINERDGGKSGFNFTFEHPETGINPIYGGGQEDMYMWQNKSQHGEQMMYFNSRMVAHNDFWLGGDNNFEMSSRGMAPWDTTGYVNAGMENCKIDSSFFVIFKKKITFQMGRFHK